MSKKLLAAAVTVMAFVGAGAAGVSAQNGEQPEISREVTPAEQTVAASGSFSVVYSECLPFEAIVFEFEGQTPPPVPCNVPGFEGDTLDRQGIVPFPSGSATATFTAPATPGTYTGIAYVTQIPSLQGFRRPAALVAQTPSPCDQQQRPDCRTFTVIVPQPPPPPPEPEPDPTTSTSSSTTTTTTATTTTVVATTTAAPTTLATTTTTEVAVVPPAPTTTAAPATLPATGSSPSDNAATIAIVLLIAGAGFVLASRWRSTPTAD